MKHKKLQVVKHTATLVSRRTVSVNAAVSTTECLSHTTPSEIFTSLTQRYLLSPCWVPWEHRSEQDRPKSPPSWSLRSGGRDRQTKKKMISRSHGGGLRREKNKSGKAGKRHRRSSSDRKARRAHGRGRSEQTAEHRKQSPQTSRGRPLQPAGPRGGASLGSQWGWSEGSEGDAVTASVSQGPDS